MNGDNSQEFFKVLLEQDTAFGVPREIAKWLAKVYLFSLRGEEALHPQIRPLIASLREYVKSLGHTLEIISTLRTWAEQDALYDQGRTTAGQIVTKAQGGQSYHNFGLAFDFMIDGKSVADLPKETYAHIVEVITKLGMVSGESWGDYGHVEYHPNFDWHELADYFKNS